jgi:glucose/arabinose dehydrogenase
MKTLCLFTLALAALPAAQAAAAAPAIDAGKAYFANNCAMCHTATPDQRALMGPGLFNVVGRRIASMPGFDYSAGLQAAAKGRAWTKDELARFLADPAAYAPGTAMPVNVADASQRAALVDYLASLQGVATGGEKAPAAPSATSEHWSNDEPGRIHAWTASMLPQPFATESASNNPRTVPRPADVVPAVPAGFGVSLWARDPDRGRVMVKAPNGDIFVSAPNKGVIKVFRSSTGKTADTVSTFAAKLDRPFGMAFWPVGPNPRYLYVAYVNAIVRIPYHNGDLQATAAPEVIVPALTAQAGAHSSRTLVFSQDGKTMYLSIGSATNVADTMASQPPEAAAQWDAAHGLGAAWGDELDRALVLAFDPDGRNKRTHAAGLRNCVGMYLYPRTGDLLCSVNERDMLGDDLPPDYLTRVRAGGFYGWPWYYIGQHEDPRKAGQRPDLANKVTVPDLLLTAHSAPLGMVMYDAHKGANAAFPKEYGGDVFVALHGSWNRHTRTGSKVVRVFMKDGVPTGRYQDFMTGFVVSDKEVWGRPSAVIVQEDGSLLVDDDVTGEIWRVAPK